LPDLLENLLHRVVVILIQATDLLWLFARNHWRIGVAASLARVSLPKYSKGVKSM
jgi:hypothetical protein